MNTHTRGTTQIADRGLPLSGSDKPHALTQPYGKGLIRLSPFLLSSSEVTATVSPAVARTDRHFSVQDESGALFVFAFT